MIWTVRLIRNRHQNRLRNTIRIILQPRQPHRRARRRQAARDQPVEDEAIGLAHDARRPHRAARACRHDRVRASSKSAFARLRPASRRPRRASGCASTAPGSVADDAGVAQRLARQIEPAASPHPRRGRAGYWSVAARGRDDARARCPPRAACRTPAPTAARPRWRRDRNKDRASPSPARGYRRPTSISMPSITARKSPARRSNRRTACARPCKLRRRRAGIERVDVAAPLLKRGLPRVARARIVGDIVDRAAERIDFEHRLALRRAAGCACRYRTSCARRVRAAGVGVVTHAPRGLCAAAEKRRPIRPKPPRSTPSKRESGDRRHGKVHALAQRIARLQDARQPVRQRVDDGNLERKPRVVDRRGKAVALAKQALGARGELVQAIEQSGRSALGAELLDARAACGERVLRNIDAVEIAIVLLAVLQMIDDLQRGAQRIVCRPDRAALAVHVADETADRHGRERTISDQIVPVAIAQLGDVELERGDQIDARASATERVRRARCAAARRPHPRRRRPVSPASRRPSRRSFSSAGRSHGRRYRRRCARNCRTPGSARDGAAQSDTTPPGNSRPGAPLPDRQVVGVVCDRVVHRASEILDSSKYRACSQDQLGRGLSTCRRALAHADRRNQA